LWSGATVLDAVFMTAKISSFGDTGWSLSLVVVVIVVFFVIFIVIVMVASLGHWNWYSKGIA